MGRHRTTTILLLAAAPLLAACGAAVQAGGYDHPTTTTEATTTTSTTTTLPPTTTTTTTLPPTTSTTLPDEEEPSTTTTVPGHKWFVCKYVGTPGLDERLQTGDNPISVDGHSIATYPNIVIGAFFADAQGRSVVIAQDIGQAEPDPDEACPPGDTGTTTTTSSTTSTTSTTTTTLPPTTTTTPPTPSLFSIAPQSFCLNDGSRIVQFTLGDRPDLEESAGTIRFNRPGTFAFFGPAISRTFVSGAVVNVAIPTDIPDLPDVIRVIYFINDDSDITAFGDVQTFPTGPTCQATETTTTTVPPTTVVDTFPTTTTPTTTVTPDTFQFSGASTVCVSEVPTIRITFGNALPDLAGQTGALTMTAVNGGAVVGEQALVYAPGTTVDILYPGTQVNADGSIADVPGWTLQSNGLWVLDPSDEYLRDGIVLTYVLNPTATATVQYPPESSACADPDGPFAPGVTPPAAGQLPRTGNEIGDWLITAIVLTLGGAAVVLFTRRKTGLES